ncbi:MAG: SPOR domain-containing protein [Ignavibacteriales bacterium]|nr:MAG: SPOR domain-containing protein [Ignavibacteriales bacterium]
MEIISEKLGIPESEQKLFFEILIREVGEKLKEVEYLNIPDTGRFEYKISADQNEKDLIVFLTNNNEELIFIIPAQPESYAAEPVDSYFSISIGKPVIPMKGTGEKEFFISHSGSEMKRFLELKVENFIEDISNPEIEIEGTNNLDDITFSFLNWKKTTDVNEEINKIEQELESLDTEAKNSENELSVSADNLILQDEEIEDEITEEIFTETDIEKETDSELYNTEDSEETEEELVIEEPENRDELLEVTDEWVNEIIDEPETIEEEFSRVNDPKEEDDSAIKEAFKYAEERKTRLDSFNKKSYGGFIFAFVIILAAAGVIYLSFYYTDRNDIPVTFQNDPPKEFNVVVERSFDIPVSFPNTAGISGSFYKAIDDNLLKPVESSQAETNIITESKTSPEPEIRNAQPSKRIRGYIYQYEDGTFAAQVSSWKSRTIALSETKKFLEAGYNAFVEQTELSGKTYYRVRVGGFNSFAEAESFLKR